MEEASAEQLEAMKAPDSNTKIGEFIRVLALDSETLLHLMPLLNEVMYGDGGLSRPETELGAVSASVANRSIYCVAAHSHQYNQLTEDHAVMKIIFSLWASAEFDPRQKALFQFGTDLSQCPSKGTKEDIDRLFGNGFNTQEILDLVLAAALFGWVNRLSMILGDPVSSN